VTTRNLLMTLTVILILAVLADRIFVGKAAATEPSLLLPPIVAAVEFEIDPASIRPSDSQLQSVKDQLRTQRRDDLEQRMTAEFRRALSDVDVRKVATD